jgi:SAM-dependent methyltransferase
MSAASGARALLYDAVIKSLTTGWYRAVLERLPAHCRLLDIGIGTGTALLAHAALIRANDLHVTGVDVDRAYVEHCRRSVEQARLSDHIVVHLQSVYDHSGGPYDAAYFSGSFMLLPDPTTALRHVGGLLARDGRLYFTQTFEHERSPVLEIVKPLLRLVTTIDFGRVTYEADFLASLAAAGAEVEEREILHAGRRRSSALIVARAFQSVRLG